MASAETQHSNQFDPNQAAQAGSQLLGQYDELVAAWQAAGHPTGTSYGADRETLQGLMSEQIEQIFTATGVRPLVEADIPVVSGRTPEGFLKLAVGVAREAGELGFTLGNNDEDAVAQAQHLIADYTEFTRSAPAVEGRTAELPPDYRDRKQAKVLLAESSARDVARRLGIENPVLEEMTLRRIQEATALDFRGPVRKIMPGSPKHEDNPHWVGPPGTTADLGLGGLSKVLGYGNDGRPITRGRDGQLVRTWGAQGLGAPERPA